MKLARIIVGVDFSECSRAALAYAMAISDRGASLEALHVVSPPTYVPMDVMIWGQQEQLFRVQLDQELSAFVASVAGAEGSRILPRVESGIPYDVLSTASEQADLLVVGTHGRTGLSHVILGSVAERTLRFARCPVLVVPGPRPRVEP